jgi:orotate phosphoribosyltransferase
MISRLRTPLYEAICSRAILRGRDQRLIGRNGAKNSWLIDMRRILTDAKFLDLAAENFWELFADKMPFQVGGMEVAAIPLVAAILMKSVARGTPVNGFIIRKERKTYGVGNTIEGTLTNDPIIIVDDVINSGGSLEKARVVLEQEGKTIAQVFVLIDYHGKKGMLWRASHMIPVTATFGLAEFGLSLGGREPPLMNPVFRQVWDFAAPDPNFFHRVPKSFPVTDGKHVYFGSDCGYLWCLDAHTGAEIWKFKVSSPGHKNIFSSPSIYDGGVFFGGYDGNVYRLDSETGAEIWRFTGADWVGSSPVLAPDLGLLFIGLQFATEGSRGSIIALNLKDGSPVWEHPTKRYTQSSPAYWPERGLVACGSNDDELFLLDAATGDMRWRFQTRGEGRKGSIRHAPAFEYKRGQIITGCADGYIYIIDVDTGNELWSVKTDNTIYTVPLVVGDTAYIGSTDKYLYVLDLEGRKVIKKLFAASKIFGPPRLIEGRIYFGACNGIIYEIDLITRQIVGTHQLPDAITNAVVYSAETKLFYVLTYLNHLYAFAHA